MGKGRWLGESPGSEDAKLPRYASIKAFLASLSLLYFCKALTAAYMKGAITSIERRFSLPSSLAGTIDGGFEMGNLLVVLVVSYLGSRLHRPRLIAVGATVMAVGTFVMALPHFFMEPYNEHEAHGHVQANGTTGDLPAHCLSRSAAATTPETGAPPAGCERGSGSRLWVLLLAGNILRGVGETPVTPLGVSYLDDFTRREDSAFYLGCVHTMGLVGPVLGFLLGSLCSRLFVNFPDWVSMHMQDKRWVGAWWLGFLVAGALSLLASLPFWAFPRNLPREKEPRRSSEMYSMPVKDILLTSGDKDECATDFPRRGSHSSTLSTSPTSLIRGIAVSLHGVLCQPLVVALLVSQVLQVMSLVGFVTFKPKFMEEQFGKTAAEANMFMGAVNVPSVALGMFGGGLLMRCLALGPLGAARLSLASGSVAWALTLAFYALRCDGPSVVGLTHAPLLASHAGARVTGCPGACECRGDAWEPVCGWDGLTYLSPCLAGCNATVGGISTQGGTAPVFTDCACVGGIGGRATLGLCARTASCDRSFHLFLGVTVASSFIYALGSTPAYFVFLRSVSSELKSFALGLQTMVTRTLAGIPAPILYGVAIDSSCTKWGLGTCGSSGVCQFYDTDAFRWIYLTLTCVLRAVSLALFAVGCGLLQQQPNRWSLP
ncbi:solute carrier organic anion transporter family member 1C1-like isoform X1 [Lampetra fluviatilis]